MLGWGSLVCKFVIFGTLLLNGASLVYLLITDASDRAAQISRIEARKAELDAETAARVKLIEAESAARQAEDLRRAKVAAEVAQVTGNASLARTVVKASTASAPAPAFALVSPSPSPIASAAATFEPVPEVPGIVERFARWYARGPLYFSGGLVGLLCFVLIQVFGKIDEHKRAGVSAGDGQAETGRESLSVPGPALPSPVPTMAAISPESPQDRSRVVWRGGRVVSGERSH